MEQTLHESKFVLSIRTDAKVHLQFLYSVYQVQRLRAPEAYSAPNCLPSYMPRAYRSGLLHFQAQREVPHPRKDPSCWTTAVVHVPRREVRMIQCDHEIRAL